MSRFPRENSTFVNLTLIQKRSTPSSVLTFPRADEVGLVEQNAASIAEGKTFRPSAVGVVPQDSRRCIRLAASASPTITPAPPEMIRGGRHEPAARRVSARRAKRSSRRRLRAHWKRRVSDQLRPRDEPDSVVPREHERAHFDQRAATQLLVRESGLDGRVWPLALRR